MKNFIIGIDEGTTSTRTGIYDIKSAKIIDCCSQPIKLNFPQSGWVEADANKIWESVQQTIIEVIGKTKTKLNDVLCISITNQRETVVAWDKKTGEAVYPSIIWQCRRTSSQINKLTVSQIKKIKSITGLIPDAYFSATKMNWLLKNNKQVAWLAKNNRLCLGTIDSFVAFKLTGNFATDTTNASRTMLMNLKTLKWDLRMLKQFSIQENYLPKIVNSNAKIGQYKINESLVDVVGIIGDQQSALVGQCCFEKGMAKNTYGTGSFMLVNTGEKISRKKKLISTVAYTINDKTNYAIEGSVFNAGSIVEWLKELEFISTASDCDKLSFSIKSTNGVKFYPALTGLGAPFWMSNLRAAYTGLSRGTCKADFVRSSLESIAYCCEAIFKEAKLPLKELRCDGGVTNSQFLMQFQADVSGLKICIPTQIESTLLGAIYMGLIGTKTKTKEQIQKLWKLKNKFEPKISKNKGNILYLDWKKGLTGFINSEKN
ncbi:MAG: glycerol kinase GlpK [Clostridia bacterium]